MEEKLDPGRSSTIWLTGMSISALAALISEGKAWIRAW